MKKLKIAVVDLFKPRSKMENSFISLLKDYYKITIDNENPDIIFHDYFENKRFKYNCPKIMFTGENRILDFNVSDYAFSSHPSSNKNQQICWVLRLSEFENYLNNSLPTTIKKYQTKIKTNFCAFVYHNQFTFGAKFRKQFAKDLMKYKRVDCPSRVLNNMPAFDGEKYKPKLPKYLVEFLSNYKFTIAFENSSSLGYVTEKIYHPFLAGSIPIYWGSPDIENYFNPKAFINCHNFKNFNEVIQKIKEIDNSPSIYQKYLNEPSILPTSKLYKFTNKNLSAQVANVIEKLQLPNFKPVYVAGIASSIRNHYKERVRQLSMKLPYSNYKLNYKLLMRKFN